MKPKEVRVAPGFALPCDIIFAQGPKAYEYEDFNEALILLLQTYQNVMCLPKRCMEKVKLPRRIQCNKYTTTPRLRTKAGCLPFIVYRLL